MVVSGVLSSETVKDTAENSDNQGDDERKDTVLRLVNTTVALSTPLDKSVGTGAKEGKSDDGDNDLTNVDITGLVLLPVVWRSGDDVTISRTDGDVGTEGQTVEAESPENIREGNETEHLLVHIDNSLHVGLANPQAEIRAESARGVTDKVELRLDGAEGDRGRGLLDSLLDIEVVLSSLLVRWERTFVLGLGQEEKSSEEYKTRETSTKTVPSLGSNLASDRAGEYRVDGSDDNLDGLLSHEVLAAFVKEVHFLRMSDMVTEYTVICSYLGDHGNKSFTLTCCKTDDTASSQMNFVALGCCAEYCTSDQDEGRHEDDDTSANAESERHTDDVTNTPMKMSAALKDGWSMVESYMKSVG
jgi:hypothetical protein